MFRKDLRSVIPEIRFTFCHTRNQIYVLSYQKSDLRSVIPEIRFTFCQTRNQIYGLSYQKSIYLKYERKINRTSYKQYFLVKKEEKHSFDTK